MIKFINSLYLKVILLLILLIFTDIICGQLFYRLYKKSSGGVAYQEYFNLNKTNQDLLVFGPSTAAYHYNPEILKQNLNVSVYNAGREGAGIFFQYAVLLATLNRYVPKYVILDVNFRDMYNNSGGNFSSEVLTELYPFYGKINSEFDSILIQNWYDKIFLQSNLIRYNDKIFNIIAGNLAIGRDIHQGFRPLKGH